MKKFTITIIILLILILLSVGGFFIYSYIMNNKSNDLATLNEKCLSEIDYLNANIITMMNKINNISYTNYSIVSEEVSVSSSEEEESTSSQSEQTSETESQNTINSSNVIEDNILSGDNNDVDWNSLKGEIENMYNSWTTILIDLTTLSINKDNLLKYNSVMDQIVEDFDNEDKSSSLIHLADLYNLLALYIKEFSQDSDEISVYNIRSNILYAYAYVESDDWNTAKTYVNTAGEELLNVFNNQVNNINSISEINESYILINELEEDCNSQSKKVFYVNYKNLMQELESI